MIISYWWPLKLSVTILFFFFSDEELQPVVAGSSQAATASSRESGKEESVFSKLEQTRTILETSLGLASLLQAYQLIQVS